MLTALRAGEAEVSLTDGALRGDELAGAVGAVAARLVGVRRVAVVATPSLATVVAIAGALEAGVTVVTINPKAGQVERDYVLSDSAPDLVLEDVDLSARAALPAERPVDDAPALIIYTSGTTGPPKGAVIPRRAIAANLDGLAEAWSWTSADRLVHALPLFHVHGLVLGTLGPLRIGSAVHHLPAFAPMPDATLYFAVPTMWSRVSDPAQFRSARLLVSGSAALPVPVFERFVATAGHRIAERYGLTETLINTAARADGDRRPGIVGTPLSGVEVRIPGDEEFGSIEVRGANVFTGYLNNPEATAAALSADGWFATGDLGALEPDGQLRIVGRQSTDLIKSGGYKIGAGEIENALLAHPAVLETAVIGVPDDDLGERVVAYVIAQEAVAPQTLIDHVAATLAPHKRPREVRFVDALPRNDMGKVQKKLLGERIVHNEIARDSVRFTLGLPTDHIEQPEFFTGDAVMRMAQVAEESGFGAVNVTDHPFPPAQWVEKGGHHDLDPIAALAFAAAATKRILLHTNIYVAAYRNPFLSAKLVATLDTLSGGRVIFGVGAGYLTPEFAALGVPFERRGARLDRALDAMVQAWTGQPVHAATPEWDATGNQIMPLPASRPHPPIWIGGNSEAAMRRVARIGSGWIPFPAGNAMAKAVRTTSLAGIPELAERIGILRGYLTESGRADEPLDVCCTPFSNPYQRQSYDAAALEQEVHELAAAGVTWMCIYLPVTDLAGYLHEIERFGDLVIRPSAS